MTVNILQGDARVVLQTLPSNSVHTVVTSPPYWGLRSYPTGLVADRLQRDCIGIELNPAYIDIARRRIAADAPLFAEVAA